MAEASPPCPATWATPHPSRAPPSNRSAAGYRVDVLFNNNAGVQYNYDLTSEVLPVGRVRDRHRPCPAGSLFTVDAAAVTFRLPR